MVSESYNISASWNLYWWWDSQIPGADNGPQPQPYPLGNWSAGYQVSPSGAITGGYDLSSSDGSPVAASTGSASPLGWSDLIASASIGLLSVQNYATAYPYGYTDAFPGFSPPLGGSLDWQGNVQTSVQAVWLFSPIYNSLEVNIYAQLYNEYGMGWGVNLYAIGHD
jgi:hypothetical protein